MSTPFYEAKAILEDAYNDISRMPGNRRAKRRLSRAVSDVRLLAGDLGGPKADDPTWGPYDLPPLKASNATAEELADAADWDD